MNIGDTVLYEGKQYEVLGFAATEDNNRFPMVEIAWDNYEISSTGYLAVSRDFLEVR